MTKKRSVEARGLAMPQTIEEASRLLAELGNLQRAAKKIADDTDAEVTRLREHAEQDLRPIHEKIAMSFELLRSFANVRRNELTDHGKKKAIKLPSGTLSWRLTPPKVLLEIDPSEILSAIESMGLEQFIRRPAPEIDKDALKKDVETAKTIPGVNVIQTEEFRLKPESGTGELNAAAVEKLLKAESA